MVEVFKTTVIDQTNSKMLLDQIHKIFHDYSANFDLDDCDKILRVTCNNGMIQSSRIIDLLKAKGFHAEILPENDGSIAEAMLKEQQQLFVQ